MENQAEFRRRLDSTKYLYLEHFGPADDLHSLKLEVVEGIVGSQRTAGIINSTHTGAIDDYDKVMETVTANSSLIEVTPESARFTIIFERYLAFSARDETYVIPEEEEDFSKKLRTYDRSKFLDFVESSTWYWDDQTPLSHHAVVCLNMVVDIVCRGNPRISIAALT